MDFTLLRNTDLVENPNPRVPICLCLDVSGTMAGERIDKLNAGVRQFYDNIRDDDVAAYSAEICIVTFGSTEAKCIADFARLEIRPDPPTLTARGLTPMGEAINLALDLLDQRKQDYKDKGVDYYQPWLVLMTDGSPNGDEEGALDRAIERTVERINAQKLVLFPIGIDEEANMDVLQKLSPRMKPIRLHGAQFSKLFSWLSKSISRVSQNIPGEDTLDLGIIGGWGTLDF